MASPCAIGDAALVAAGTAAALATVPEAADAFVYKGKEYFDITYGIPVWQWIFAAFVVISFGAWVKNTALRENKPFGTNTVANPAPLIGRGKKFVNKLEETKAPPFRGAKFVYGKG